MRWARAAELLVAGGLVFCVAARGGAADWAVAPAVGLAFAALCMAVLATRSGERTFRVPTFAWIPAGVALLCLLQALPLPLVLLSKLSPYLASVSESLLRPLGLERPRPLSLDPPRTLFEAAKHLGYAMTLTAAHVVARESGARRRIILAVSGTAALLAAVGLLHLLAGAHTLFGVMRFSEATPPVVTPFGNPNHLAGFLAMGVTPFLALGLLPTEGGRRVTWAVVYVLTAACLFASLSRGGILAFVSAQLLLLALAAGARRARGRGLGFAPVLGLLLALTAVAVGGYLASEALWAELFPRGVSALPAKTAQWPEVARVASQFPLGMGRGAFVFGFGAFQARLGTVVFTHPENAVLQLAADLGFGLGLGVVGLCLWQWLRSVRHRSGGGGGTVALVELAALCGVAGLALQNLFDFGLEHLASATGAAVLLGATAPAGRPLRWRAAAAGVLGVGALAVFSLGLAGSQATADEAALSRAQGSAAEVLPRALAAIDRHPTDPWLYLRAAAALADDPKAAPQSALAWVNRALLLRPSDPEAHWIAARALLRMGRITQAMAEYRTYSARGGREEVIYQEALPRARGARAVRALLPEGGELTMLRYLATHERGEEVLAVVEAFADEGLSLGAGWELPLLRVTLLRERGRIDEASSLLASSGALAQAGDVAEVQVEKARVLSAKGRGEEGRAGLADFLSRHPDALEAARALALEQLSAGLPQAARATVKMALARRPGPDARIALHLLEAEAFDKEGLPRRALDSVEHAMQVRPDETWLRLQVARRLEALGRFPDAARQVREAMRRAREPLPEASAWLETLAQKEREQVARRRAAVLEASSDGGASPD